MIYDAHDEIVLRQALKAKRRALRPEVQAEAALHFLSSLSHFFKSLSGPHQVGVYLAGKGELDLTPSIDWLWQQGYLLYAPVLSGESLSFCAYTPDTPLVLNAYQLREPTGSPSIRTEDLDYVLVPLLAFDPAGHRLGMGKGYYDRSFAFRKHTARPILIGCAYGFQEVPQIDPKPHDIRMDHILVVD